MSRHLKATSSAPTVLLAEDTEAAVRRQVPAFPLHLHLTPAEHVNFFRPSRHKLIVSDASSTLVIDVGHLNCLRT